MDRVAKALRKLSPKERVWVKETIMKLAAGQTRGLDIQKLKGTTDFFRVRRGDIRILYRFTAGKAIILRIERRSEKTYR